MSTDFTTILERLECPAFIVENGIITHTNHKASAFAFLVGQNISDRIIIGASTYESFPSGQLYLTLSADEIPICACVTRNNTYDLFCIESEYDDLQLRTFALVSQILREPLSGAMNAVDALNATSASNEDNAQLRILNKNLHRILRAVCNLSDASVPDAAYAQKTQNCIINSVISRIAHNAADALKTTGIKVEYISSPDAIHCAIDVEKIERALLNMISNAAKFSDPGESIKVQAYRANARYNISVTSLCQNAKGVIEQSFFSRFGRNPGIENPSTGIGLGMTLIRNAAIAHEGTVLVDTPDEQHLRVTMSLSIKQNRTNTLRSPIVFETDYSGGYDHILLELSDILDPNHY